MGLASVYGTVRTHGGNVSVYSEVGKGSTFRIYLPLADAGAPARALSFETLPALTPRQVLVIDDEPLVREQFGRALRDLGHVVDLVESGAHALARCEANQGTYDVVVLDVVMPGMGGRETYRALHTRYPQLRVIVSSGFALDGDVQAILDEGARTFLQKPFLRAALARALMEALAT
jgi:two-component system, cell cycle sensor histidine kinase and response regulator CckA